MRKAQLGKALMEANYRLVKMARAHDDCAVLVFCVICGLWVPLGDVLFSGYGKGRIMAQHNSCAGILFDGPQFEILGTEE